MNGIPLSKKIRISQTEQHFEFSSRSKTWSAVHLPRIIVSFATYFSFSEEFSTRKSNIKLERTEQFTFFLFTPLRRMRYRGEWSLSFLRIVFFTNACAAAHLRFEVRWDVSLWLSKVFNRETSWSWIRMLRL